MRTSFGLQITTHLNKSITLFGADTSIKVNPSFFSKIDLIESTISGLRISYSLTSSLVNLFSINFIATLYSIGFVFFFMSIFIL